MEISVARILTDFPVDLSVAGWLLIGILFNESGLQIVTDIYDEPQLAHFNPHPYRKNDTIQVDIDSPPAEGR